MRDTSPQLIKRSVNRSGGSGIYVSISVSGSGGSSRSGGSGS